MPDLRRETSEAVAAVLESLEIAGRPLTAGDITSKGGRDLVTKTDVAIEDAIRRRLTNALGFPVAGEERGGDIPVDGSPYWLVDPICGTRNYASGIPLFCVNLALVEGDEVTTAVVADPSTGELLLAERGLGAWTSKDGAQRRLKVDAASHMAIIEDGKAMGARREHAARFASAAMLADRWDLRSLGSTLSLSYVATGRVAAYAVFWVSAVHSAAGSLLASEAGAVLSDIAGEPWTLRSDSLIASADEALHAELLSLARSSLAAE